MFAPCRKNLGDDLIDLQASAIVSAATSPRQQFSAPEAQITPGLSRIVCQVKNPEQSRLHQTAAVHQAYTRTCKELSPAWRFDFWLKNHWVSIHVANPSAIEKSFQFGPLVNIPATNQTTIQLRVNCLPRAGPDLK